MKHHKPSIFDMRLEIMSRHIAGTDVTPRPPGPKKMV